jgi:HSF-type DNA-binding
MKLVDAAASLGDTKKCTSKLSFPDNGKGSNLLVKMNDETKVPLESMIDSQDDDNINDIEKVTSVGSVKGTEETLSIAANRTHTPSPQPSGSQDDDDTVSHEEETVLVGTREDLVRRSERKMTFAEFLMKVLDDRSNHDIISWMPEGDAFTILNHRKFTMDRMPKLFKIRNMSSFVRKLTRWGFSRVHQKETGNCDIFRHEYFLRGKPELARKIRCLNRAAEAAAAAQAAIVLAGAAATVTATASKQQRRIAASGGGGGGSGSVNKITPPRFSRKDQERGETNSVLRHVSASSSSTSTPPQLGNDGMRAVSAHEAFMSPLQNEDRFATTDAGNIHASKEQAYVLARQEQIRRLALLRQEADLHRQRQDVLNQQHQLNHVSPEYQKAAYTRMQGNGGIFPVQNTVPRMSPQEIIRQQHQLQQQQKRIEQQQRILDVAKIQHEQELVQHQQQHQQNFPLQPLPPNNTNQRPMSLTDYEIEMELDLLSTSNRSLDFLGTSARSLDLLGASGRSIDLLNSSSRSFGGHSIGHSANTIGASSETPLSILRGGSSQHLGFTKSPPHHQQHQRLRFLSSSQGGRQYPPLMPDRNFHQQSMNHEQSRQHHNARGGSHLLPIDSESSRGSFPNPASQPVMNAALGSLRRDEHYTGGERLNNSLLPSNGDTLHGGDCRGNFNASPREEIIRTMLRRKQEQHHQDQIQCNLRNGNQMHPPQFNSNGVESCASNVIKSTSSLSMNRLSAVPSFQHRHQQQHGLENGKCSPLVQSSQKDGNWCESSSSASSLARVRFSSETTVPGSNNRF